MNKFFSFLENKLMPIANVFSSQRHLLAMRDGVVSAIPFTIIGSIFLIIANPPFSAETLTGIQFIDSMMMGWIDWAGSYSPILMTPYQSTMNIMSVFIEFVIAYSLAKSYDKKAINYAISSFAVYLLIVTPITEGVIDIAAFGGKGILLAIIIALLSVELMRFFEDKGFTIKLPEGVPPMVANAFSSLFPFLFTITIFFLISVGVQSATGKIIPDLFFTMFEQVKSGIDNPAIITFLTMLEELLFGFGVHPSTVIAGPILDPLALINLQENSANYMANAAALNVYTTPFKSFVAAIGGCGATLGLAIMLLKCKSKQLKNMGKVSILPSIFNINEPLVFGLPIFLNPLLIIPFMITPAVNIVIGWFVTSIGLVNTAVVNAPWTAPAPLAYFISTLDFKAFILVILLIILDAAIYYPFLKVYDQQKLHEENNTDNKSEVNIHG